MDLGSLMRRGVADDDVDVEIFGHVSVDEVQEPSELEGAVALGHVGDHLSRGDVEGRVEIGGAVAPVVAGASLGWSRSQREDGGGAIQGLHWGLLIHAEHEGAFGRIEVKAHYVPDSFNEMGIGRELEGVDQMRFEPEGTPDAAHATRGLVSAALSTSIRRSSWSGTGRV